MSGDCIDHHFHRTGNERRELSAPRCRFGVDDETVRMTEVICCRCGHRQYVRGMDAVRAIGRPVLSGEDIAAIQLGSDGGKI